MKKAFLILAAVGAVSFASAAYAADSSTTKYSRDGSGYETTNKSEYTNANGTTHSSESTVDEDTDSSGRLHKTIKKEAVTDPKGMMNKKRAASKTDIEEKANGGYKQTTTSKHTDADGTDITYKTVTDVDVDNEGNVITTAATEKTVDPKGLMNQKTTSTKTKTVNGRVVQQRKNIDQ